MRIPLSWVNQFVPLPKLSIEEIGRRFTLGACEVEAILCEQELWSQVQLVEVLAVEAHPNADKLFCPTISNGSEEIRLVCGADNLYPGLMTLWAPEGTEMPSAKEGTITLKNREIMGVLSRGMLCSEKELNLSDNHEGIIDLSAFCQKNAANSWQLGMNFAELLARCLQFGEALQLYDPKEKKSKNKTELALEIVLEFIPEFILDIDNKSLTHRPDMWGVQGIAREFGALFPRCESTGSKKNQLIPYGKSLFQKPLVELQEKVKQQKKSQVSPQMSPQAPLKASPKDASPMKISIDKDSSCLAYCALSIDGVQIGQSPEWMQRRLKMSGVNVINSIVDISNYVMLECGAPNHIFDRDRLSGDEIRVYKLAENQDFETLDGQTRQLQAGDTVVADSQKPQVIAGIMGGRESSVQDSTQNILLELAVWDSYATHKTSMRLGLRTDSSLRYEKSLDPFSIEENLWRLCQLILECHPEAKICGELQRYYRDESGRNGLSITTSVAKISQVLGYPLAGAEGRHLVEQIFSNLGFRTQKVQQDGASDSNTSENNTGQMLVQVPSFRTSKDISLEEDLIEEVGRIVGFDNITAQSPLTEIRPSSLGSEQQLARTIRNFLVLNGNAQEVLSYPMIGERLLEQSRWQDKNETLKLLNPLNPEQDRMRPSLIPSHLELVARNANKFSSFCLFELGRSYKKLAETQSQMKAQAKAPAEIQTLIQEQQYLLISAYGTEPLVELRNNCERLLKHLGQTIKHSEWQNSPKTLPDFPDLQTWPGMHPTECITWRGEKLENLPDTCIIFSVHPALLRNFKLKAKLAMACIPLGPVALPKEQQKAQKSAKTRFTQLQRFPSVSFDCTVVLPPKTFAADAVHVLEQYTCGSKKQNVLAKYLQAVFVRSVYSQPSAQPDSQQNPQQNIAQQGETRWLTLQCIFAASDKTLESQEITKLENQVLEILEASGFPLKMEAAK